MLIMCMAAPSLNFAKEATREQRSKHYSLVQPLSRMRKALDSNPRPEKHKTNNTGEERRYSRRAEEERGREERGRGEQGKRRKDNRARKENFMAPCKMKPQDSIAD